MNLAFLLIALVTLTTGTVAMLLRNLIHSALLLVATWAGIAAFYLLAGAEFIAFAQLLVYVGAVSMVVLFAVLLTRRSRAEFTLTPPSVTRAIGALIVGGAVLGVLWGAVAGTGLREHPNAGATMSVRQIGNNLMQMHAPSVIIAGVLLTVALIGAVVVAATADSSLSRARPQDTDEAPNTLLSRARPRETNSLPQGGLARERKHAAEDGGVS